MTVSSQTRSLTQLIGQHAPCRQGPPAGAESRCIRAGTQDAASRRAAGGLIPRAPASRVVSTRWCSTGSGATSSPACTSPARRSTRRPWSASSTSAGLSCARRCASWTPSAWFAPGRSAAPSCDLEATGTGSTRSCCPGRRTSTATSSSSRPWPRCARSSSRTWPPSPPRSRTEAEALELAAALAAMERADWDIERFIDADVLFHRVLLWATHNELLAQMGSVIESAIRNHDRGVSAQHWVESIALHREVADAVARRSPGDAEAGMRRVLAQALSDVVGADVAANGSAARPPSAPSSRPPAPARRRQAALVSEERRSVRWRAVAKGRDGRRCRRCPDPRRGDGPAGRHRVPTLDRPRVGGLYDLAGRFGWAVTKSAPLQAGSTTQGPRCSAASISRPWRPLPPARRRVPPLVPSRPADRPTRGGCAPSCSGWPLLLDYRVSSEFPRIRLAFELTRPAAEVRPVRNVELELALALDAAEWLAARPRQPGGARDLPSRPRRRARHLARHRQPRVARPCRA